MPMRIAMIIRTTLFTVFGGDTVQVTETAHHLRLLGNEVDVCLADDAIPYEKYDILHFFNIIRPADILRHITLSGKPFVVSPIYVDYSEYDKLHRTGISGLIARIVSPGCYEYLKTLGRWVKGRDRINSLLYLRLGHSAAIQRILQQAGMLLPNSVSEQKRLMTKYSVKTAMKVVCNGINPGDFPDEQLPTREADLVICVGRIEGIKNQLQLIRALNNSGFRLLIIGDPAPGHLAYYHACRAIAGDNVRFIAHLPQAELLVYYQTAKVHVLPSFFETTGLSSLEAGAMGCRIVVSNRGDVADYFGNYACYCEPDDAGSILQAVQTAAQQPLDWGLRELILHKYSWQKAARETEAAYKWVYEQKKSAHWHHGFTGHTQ